jgi:hypothetical protein
MARTTSLRSESPRTPKDNEMMFDFEDPAEGFSAFPNLAPHTVNSTYAELSSEPFAVGSPPMGAGADLPFLHHAFSPSDDASLLATPALDFDLSVYVAEREDVVGLPSLFPSFESSFEPAGKDAHSIFERAFSFTPEASVAPSLTRSNSRDETPSAFETMSPVDLKMSAPSFPEEQRQQPAKTEEGPTRLKRGRSSSAKKEKLPPRPFNGTRNTKVPPVPVDAPTVRRFVLFFLCGLSDGQLLTDRDCACVGTTCSRLQRLAKRSQRRPASEVTNAWKTWMTMCVERSSRRASSVCAPG